VRSLRLCGEKHSFKGEKFMNAIKKFWKLIPLVAVIALALALAGVRNIAPVQAHDGDGNRHTISIPLGSTGLTFGEGIRATLTNLGTRRINTQIKVIDADGIVVKQEPLALEPNQMRSFALSRSEMARNESSVLLRTEVVAQREDARNLWMTSEVIDWSTGSTRFQSANAGCSSWACTSNHNETLVRDTAPVQ
jgi:hypothetical protein